MEKIYFKIIILFMAYRHEMYQDEIKKPKKKIPFIFRFINLDFTVGYIIGALATYFTR